MDKRTCVMYDDWMTLISQMTEAQAGELIKSIAAYRLSTEYTATDQTVLVILPMILSRLEEDAKKYEEKCRKNAESGRKGGKQKHANARGRMQELANASERYQTQTNPSECEPNDHEHDHDNDINTLGMSEKMTEAMNTWIETRSQIGRYPYASITQTLSMATDAEKKHGADKCVALINKAIAGGWKSIPWDELDGKTNGKPNTWNTEGKNNYDWDKFEAQILAAQGN